MCDHRFDQVLKFLLFPVGSCDVALVTMGGSTVMVHLVSAAIDFIFLPSTSVPVCEPKRRQFVQVKLSIFFDVDRSLPGDPIVSHTILP